MIFFKKKKAFEKYNSRGCMPKLFGENRCVITPMRFFGKTIYKVNKVKK